MVEIWSGMGDNKLRAPLFECITSILVVFGPADLSTYIINFSIQGLEEKLRRHAKRE